MNKTEGTKENIIVDAKFRKVFWAWQNYFIDTKDAHKLLRCSRETFENFAITFMTSPEYRDLYEVEFNLYMKDYEEKPIRGYTKIADETRHQFLMIGRSMAVRGDRRGASWRNPITFEWSFEKVVDACKKYGFSKLIFEDFYRYRLNYKNAKHLIHNASEKFSKGPEYLEQLKAELGKIDTMIKSA